jgi:hypothetical protein
MPEEEDAMLYLCLVYIDETKLNALPRADFDALVAEHIAYDDELKRSGHFIAAEALEPVATATTVRVRNGRIVTTDGPFAETKEQLGGFFLVNARDLNDALEVAAGIPSARIGCVEVRPIDHMGKTQQGLRG